jgi:hypothetical protein
MSEKITGPWAPAIYDVADVAAIQSMTRGEATAEQQKRAIKWIIESACGTYDQTYWPGGEDGRRNTDFAEGKRFVGNSIVKMTRLNTMSLKERGDGK